MGGELVEPLPLGVIVGVAELEAPDVTAALVTAPVLLVTWFGVVDADADDVETLDDGDGVVMLEVDAVSDAADVAALCVVAVVTDDVVCAELVADCEVAAAAVVVADVADSLLDDGGDVAVVVDGTSVAADVVVVISGFVVALVVAAALLVGADVDSDVVTTVVDVVSWLVRDVDSRLVVVVCEVSSCVWLIVCVVTSADVSADVVRDVLKSSSVVDTSVIAVDAVDAASTKQRHIPDDHIILLV